MEVIEKLRVMLPHWIEHNRGHGEEFARWAEEIAGTDAELAEKLRRAVHSLEHAQEALEQALAQVGGPAESKGTGHGHRHDHGHHHHH
jgi:ERCC4-type nuclease